MDDTIADLVRGSDKSRTLAIWAADCAERVLPYFETKCPHDDRPREAIEACRAWATTGIFKMADVRRASLGAHAAAREVEDDGAARSAARAAGQALATAHVRTHSIAAARYAATAIRDATGSGEAVIAERRWQYRHLVDLLHVVWGNAPLLGDEGPDRL
jgi:hypothetical protein